MTAFLSLLTVAAALSTRPATPPAPPPTPAPTPQDVSARPSSQPSTLAKVPPTPRPPASVTNVPYTQFRVELPMIQRNVVPDLVGRLGGMAMDIENNILYVAGAAANAIEVHKVAGSKSIQTLSDIGAPGSLVFINDSRTLVASCTADGACRTFTAAPDGQLTPQHSLAFAGDIGPLVYDPAAKRCWVGHGVFVSSFDPITPSKGSEISLESIGRPIDLALSSTSPRLYAITTHANDVVVINRDAGKVEARWPLSEHAPAAVALDEYNNRLFVATRTPARLIVLDTTTGKEIAKLEAPDEPGSVCYDPYLRKVYIAGNRGHLRAYAQTAPDTYSIITTEQTVPGSRSALLVPEHRRLIVSAPNLGGNDEKARLFIYQVGP